MTSDRPAAAFGFWKASEEKLDYFLAGVSAALAAYLGKSLALPSTVDLPHALELLAAATFVASFIAAIKRLEFSNAVKSATYRRLEHLATAGRRVEESKQGMAIDPVRSTLQTSDDLIAEGKEHDKSAQAQASIETSMELKSSTAYKWRNRLLIVGFVVLAASRLAPLFTDLINAITG